VKSSGQVSPSVVGVIADKKKSVVGVTLK